MSVNYAGILWNRQKKRYDTVIAIGILSYLALFIGLHAWLHPNITTETLIIRATGTLAFLMLHIILSIGPLARLNPVFLPLLYNRRHLGVSLFIIASVHGLFNILQFHAGGNANPLVSVLTAGSRFPGPIYFPFQPLGLLALVIFFFMAATSHDFWLKNLTPRIWKSVHMLIYMAYALIVLHVVLGVIQLEKSPVLIGFMGLGMLLIIGLHLAAGWQAWRTDYKPITIDTTGWIRVGPLQEIRNNRAKIVQAGDETIAIFRYDGKLSAVSNVCRHQNGPLGEGKIIDGCITCPWHGYQYRPEDGCSPPPFPEKVETYELALSGSDVWVNPAPLPEGTYVEPIRY
ncbi:Rieske 2Fe-2S domain-containing protein [Spirosoma sp. SC4-14]|uniref:Rieske 2Fe-2S domain-containing protein n=1 Tax=Spirosoma sp. SC4-14 TaxID=3128900 RepID=UPI0030D4555B